MLASTYQISRQKIPRYLAVSKKALQIINIPRSRVRINIPFNYALIILLNSLENFDLVKIANLGKSVFTTTNV